MATTNGLPTLKIAFEKAAAAVVSRTKKGVAAVMVRDENAQGVYSISSTLFIPSGLGEANNAHIRTAFQGSDRGEPSQVVLVVIAPGTSDTTALEAGLKLLEAYSIDYLAGPPDVTEDELDVLNTWVLAQREQYNTVKLVRPYLTAGSDEMGIIELDETGLANKDGPVTAAAYCARLAGIFAGIPVSMSATNVSMSELTAVTPRTMLEQQTAINNGKLIFVHDGLQAYIARAVNSLTTIPDKGNEDWSKIKIVEGMDLIRYYLRNTIRQSYMGRYANTYDNKQLLVAAIQDYFQYLESAGVLNSGQSYAQVDYDRQLEWINTQGVSTTNMSRQEVLEYQTGSWVFIRCGGRLVDAQEDFEVVFNTL